LHDVCTLADQPEDFTPTLPKERESRILSRAESERSDFTPMRAMVLPKGRGEGKGDARTTRGLRIEFDVQPRLGGWRALSRSPLQASGFAGIC
jgi:hypothetical protein